VTTLELRRGPASIAVDVDFGFDPLLWRYWQRIGKELKAFRADVVHIISPGDFSILGACWAHKLGIPIIASFHTNLHQFAAQRLHKTLRFLPVPWRGAICDAVEAVCAKGLLKFYEIPRVSLAPNPELQQWLERGTGRVCRLMRRGVDTELFNPAARVHADGEFRLGYVGRLMSEKNVRLLAEVERALVELGLTRYRFVIVGQGAERAWLQKNLRRVEFTGVLRGEELAQAYADMDLFVFPSRADAFGNVVLEALASGVPAVVTNAGGPKYIVNDGVTGYVAEDDREFIAKVVTLFLRPAMLQQMKVAARQSAQAMSWERILEEVWESYEFCSRQAGKKAEVLPQPNFAATAWQRRNADLSSVDSGH
jgi:glycosyltransferase involved in cell wall biosynthesis